MRCHYEPPNEEGSVHPTEMDTGEEARGRRRVVMGVGVVIGDPGMSSSSLR